MPKKKFNFDDYWAESIFRRDYEGGEYLFAYVRRKHSHDDINMEGEGTWIGLAEKPVYRMTLDKNEDSDTYNQRIPEVNEVEYQDGHIEKIPIQTGTKFDYTYKVNDTNIANFKKLFGHTIQGSTQLIWCTTNNKQLTCHYPDEFWTTAVSTVYDNYLKNKSINAKKEA